MAKKQEQQAEDTVGQDIADLSRSLHDGILKVITEGTAELRKGLQAETLEDGRIALRIEGQEAQNTATVLIAAPLEALIMLLYSHAKPTTRTLSQGVPLFFYIKSRVNEALDKAAVDAVQELAQHDKEEAASLTALFKEQGVDVTTPTTPEA